MTPNRAFDRTAGMGRLLGNCRVAASRLTWSCQAATDRAPRYNDAALSLHSLSHSLRWIRPVRKLQGPPKATTSYGSLIQRERPRSTSASSIEIPARQCLAAPVMSRFARLRWMKTGPLFSFARLTSSSRLLVMSRGQPRARRKSP
jgi:hypothetical protein